VLTFLLLLGIGLHPVERFAREHPGSQRFQSADGQRLVHASGFLVDTGTRRPEDAARAFLSSHGAAFGVTEREILVLKGGPAPGAVGAVHFQRTIEGLPVFGGDLVVGVDEHGRVFLVNGGPVAASVSGRHSFGEVAAQRAAVSSFKGGVRGAGPATVAAGWRAFGASMRAVYRVDFIAQRPAGDWRAFVDGEIGAVLFREDVRSYATAAGRVFEVSPTETLASACSLNGSGHSFCASPVSVTIPNLVTGANLAGSQTTVYNCKGADYPTTPGTVATSCGAPVDAAGGAFNFNFDSTYKDKADDFAAAMAYYHLDKHVSFLKSIDPTLPPAGTTSSGSSRAVRGSLPALVNAFQNAAPLENAFFSGGLDAMVFGQGATADYAYDASVMYHEFTHGAVFAWGGFQLDIDSLGGVIEPKGVNEGTADSMAVSELGRSQIGGFVSATMNPPAPYFRDQNDPNASRTCQGDGTLINQLGTTNPIFINGLDGEEHDDGEIWNGFYWEVYQGLKLGGFKACGGSCDAGPAIQYKAIQLAGGTVPTYDRYWNTFKAAATALFPAQPAVASYVDCVARRRKLDRCDRTIPVYAGEHKLELIQLRFSPFQIALQATGATQFRACGGGSTATTVYARKGAPAQITNIDPTTHAATVTADITFAPFTQACSGGTALFNLPSSGTWYLLLDSPNALPPDSEIYRIDASPNGMASRPAATAATACQKATTLAIAPGSASVAPRGQTAFAATGGSGTGYVWSLPTNGSGGSIDASTGAYTAGPTGNVTDTVRVTDSVGNSASVNVTVTAPPQGGGGGGGCSTGGVPEAALLLLGLTGLLRLRRARISR